MKLWNVLTNIKRIIKDFNKLPKQLHLKDILKPEEIITTKLKGSDISIWLHNEYFNENFLLSDSFFTIDYRIDLELSEEDIRLFELYLPYCFLDLAGKQFNKCFSISHFAQTLDGKIATTSGNSKWIGNEENLIHSHRMRALCSGILVGANTLFNDNPKLNVRNVAGNDPIKIILLGNSKAKLGDENFYAIEPKTMVFEYIISDEDSYTGFSIDGSSENNLSEVLNTLKRNHVYSIYIEGGSYTTSCFLNQGVLDQVQLHISSKIIGSGIDAFQIEGIENIADSISFQNSRFIPVGDEIMFIGNLHRRIN